MKLDDSKLNEYKYRSAITGAQNHLQSYKDLMTKSFRYLGIADDGTFCILGDYEKICTDAQNHLDEMQRLLNVAKTYKNKSLEN